MGQFSLERKPDSTGIATLSAGYYLLYNGNYVMRQQNDGKWIKFETLDANFDPDYFEVLDIDKVRSVRAKFLKYNGDYVLRPEGNPYIVPYTFDFNQFIARYKSLADSPDVKLIMARDFFQGGIDDLQRSYDGIYGYSHSPVPSFTAGANFVYGVASSIVGLSIDDSLYYGGLVNRLFGKNPGPVLGNNPENPPNIGRGYSFVESLRSYGELSTSPNTPYHKADTNNNTYDFTTNFTTLILEPTRYFLEFEIKAGDDWDALEAIYGPKIRDLPEYGTLQLAGNKRLQIEVTGDELAKLYYSGKLRTGDRGFAIIGDGGVLSHLSAHFGDEITPDTLAKVNGVEKDSVNPGQNITVFSVPSNDINSTSITSISNSSALSQAAEFEQRWQNNFQTILGPDNSLFVDAEKGIPNKYGVLIEVDDFGNPTYEGLLKTIEQEEFINRVNETTVGEYRQIAWNGYLQDEEVGS
ncbi:hypothetical protein [Sporomusa sp.]|uniref:hypothetical protein n=1 Tax=Sporomusa sp. TaxID=2078658 RepID=UPI002B557B9C|nr:hypothetical protein [Sporomusa sp.]HWR42708.1 hypothetical protein [Sporomusa sp.]